MVKSPAPATVGVGAVGEGDGTDAVGGPGGVGPNDPDAVEQGAAGV